jgi:hypothetical protein
MTSLLTSACESGVEDVDGWDEIQSVAWLWWGVRKVEDGLVTLGERQKPDENKRFDKVFHFCEAPTVTAGLIGLAFDISEVLEVAP